MILSRKILLYIFFLFFHITNVSANTLDSLENVLRAKITGNNVNEQLSAYFELGKAYFNNKENDKALEYLLATESLAKKLKNKDVYNQVRQKLGACYSARHENDLAIETYTNLIKDISKDDLPLLGKTYHQLAKIYRFQGNYELSFDYHYKALQIREELNDENGVAESYYQIGSIHFRQGNFHKSIEYFNKSLELAEKLEYEKYIIYNYGAIGGSYSRLGQVELSKEFNLKAFNLSMATTQKNGLSFFAFNLGDNYQALGNLEEALKYFEQAHTLNIEANNRWGQINTNKAIGEIYIDKNNKEKGLNHLNKSLEIAQDLGARSKLPDVYISLARNHQYIGNYKESNFYYQNFIALKDSLVNEATIQKMADTKAQYEITQKEKALQKRDSQLQDMYRNFLIAGLFALIIFLWQVTNKYRTQTKHNKTQREKNEKIQQQNEELAKVHLTQVETNQLLKEQNEKILLQNNSLENKNEELQRFAYIASHDLKEPLRNIGSFATLLKRRFKGQLGKDADEYIDFITTNVSRMYDLLHEVLMYSKLENEEITSEWISLNKIVQTVKETLRGKIMEQNVTVNIDQLPEVKGHRSHLMQLFQNLISNSIKYNKNEKPLVEVGLQYNVNGHERVYFVKDNGIGLDMEFKERVFEIFKRLHGKDEFEGTGVGLAICKKIVNQNHGDIWVESEVGEGATFYFTLNIETRMPEIESSKIEVAVQGIPMN